MVSNWSGNGKKGLKYPEKGLWLSGNGEETSGMWSEMFDEMVWNGRESAEVTVWNGQEMDGQRNGQEFGHKITRKR